LEFPGDVTAHAKVANHYEFHRNTGIVSKVDTSNGWDHIKGLLIYLGGGADN